MIFSAKMRLVLTAFAISAALEFPARAADFPYSLEQPLDYHFSSYRSCYGRVYAPAHLKKHPDQKVAEISLSHFPNKQELLGMDSPFQPYPDTPKLVLRLSVLMRDSARNAPGAIWTENAICDPEGPRLHCRIECDAGDFFVEEKQDGIVVTGGSDLYFTQCDAGDKVLVRKPDDVTFFLPPLPASHCAAD